MQISINQNLINTICDQEGVTYLGLFGSQARGDANKSSDVDLLVNFKQTKSLFQLARIQEKLEGAFDKRVDLVLNTSIKESLKPYILKDLVTLYGRSGFSIERGYNYEKLLDSCL